MAITPDPQAMYSVSQIMAKSLIEMHRIIETECDPNNPKVVMALMMAFINGITLQLRDKVETLEQGLGNQLLAAVNEITKANSSGRETLEKLNRNDPSLDESPSGIAPDDLPSAINFLVKKLLSDIQTHFNELPFLLRNETTLLHSLSVVVAKLLYGIDSANLESAIDAFSRNVRLIAFSDQDDASNRKYH